jgi:hypothetical protein
VSLCASHIVQSRKQTRAGLGWVFPFWIDDASTSHLTPAGVEGQDVSTFIHKGKQQKKKKKKKKKKGKQRELKVQMTTQQQRFTFGVKIPSRSFNRRPTTRPPSIVLLLFPLFQKRKTRRLY